MRVLVTGATGFLGSYVATALVERGHDVTALVRPGSSRWRLDDVSSRMQLVAGGVDEHSALATTVATVAPEAVVHLAWSGVGNQDRDDPAQDANVDDAAALVEAAADAGASTFVGAGSQAEYGAHDRAIVESDVPAPTTRYGSAKLAAATVTERLAAERGVRWAWLRIFSTYGPKDHDRWLIPSVIEALRAGRRVPLTAAEQRWGFLYASDAADAFVRVVESPHASGIYNLGAPDAPVLRTTIERLRDLVDPSGDLGFGEVPYRPDQVMVLQADVSRLRALGWRPRFDLDVGLRDTAEWHVRRG